MEVFGINLATGEHPVARKAALGIALDHQNFGDRHGCRVAQAPSLQGFLDCRRRVLPSMQQTVQRVKSSRLNLQRVSLPPESVRALQHWKGGNPTSAGALSDGRLQRGKRRDRGDHRTSKWSRMDHDLAVGRPGTPTGGEHVESHFLGPRLKGPRGDMGLPQGGTSQLSLGCCIREGRTLTGDSSMPM